MDSSLDYSTLKTTKNSSIKITDYKFQNNMKKYLKKNDMQLFVPVRSTTYNTGTAKVQKVQKSN